MSIHVTRGPNMVKKGDLPDLTGAESPRLILLCRQCGSEYSAHRGDYFLYWSGDTLTCCSAPLELVTRRAGYDPA